PPAPPVRERARRPASPVQPWYPAQSITVRPERADLAVSRLSSPHPGFPPVRPPNAPVPPSHSLKRCSRCAHGARLQNESEAPIRHDPNPTRSEAQRARSRAASISSFRAFSSQLPVNIVTDVPCFTLFCFRWAAHTGGIAVVKLKDYDCNEEVESSTPYAAWKTLASQGLPLRPGDVLESLSAEDAPADLKIAKYIGFEPAKW